MAGSFEIMAGKFEIMAGKFELRREILNYGGKFFEISGFWATGDEAVAATAAVMAVRHVAQSEGQSPRRWTGREIIRAGR